MVTGVVGGVVLGAVLVLARHGLSTRGPSASDPKILFRSLPPEGGSYTAEEGARDTDRELLTGNC